MFKKYSLKTKITLAGLVITAISTIGVPIFLHYSSKNDNSQDISNLANRKGPPMGAICKINTKYHPSGIMGDTGDIRIAGNAEIDRFVFEIKGRGPHEWNWKYVNGELNARAAQFGGVMYLNPPDNWGQIPHGGGDLAKACRIIKWEARSVDNDVMAEFVIGGVEWFWDAKGQKINAPYPDSMPRLSLGILKLTKDWENFEYNLSDQPKEYFTRVVGGFGWVIDWGSNNISPNDEGTAPLQTKTFTIELRNIRYER